MRGPAVSVLLLMLMLMCEWLAGVRTGHIAGGWRLTATLHVCLDSALPFARYGRGFVQRDALSVRARGCGRWTAKSAIDSSRASERRDERVTDAAPRATHGWCVCARRSSRSVCPGRREKRANSDDSARETHTLREKSVIECVSECGCEPRASLSVGEVGARGVVVAVCVAVRQRHAERATRRARAEIAEHSQQGRM